MTSARGGGHDTCRKRTMTRAETRRAKDKTTKTANKHRKHLNNITRTEHHRCTYTPCPLERLGVGGQGLGGSGLGVRA